MLQCSLHFPLNAIFHPKNALVGLLHMTRVLKPLSSSRVVIAGGLYLLSTKHFKREWAVCLSWWDVDTRFVQFIIDLLKCIPASIGSSIWVWSTNKLTLIQHGGRFRPPCLPQKHRQRALGLFLPCSTTKQHDIIWGACEFSVKAHLHVEFDFTLAVQTLTHGLFLCVACLGSAFESKRND